jgi:hypothetical protein
MHGTQHRADFGYLTREKGQNVAKRQKKGGADHFEKTVTVFHHTLLLDTKKATIRFFG